MIAAGIDSTNSMTITLSSLGNVGPTLGLEIGPTMSWNELPDFAKWISSFLMLVGRLELFSVLVLFTPRSGKRTKTKLAYKAALLQWCFNPNRSLEPKHILFYY